MLGYAFLRASLEEDAFQNIHFKIFTNLEIGWVVDKQMYMIVLPFKFDQMGFEIIANAKKDSSQFFEYLLCKDFSSLFCNKDQMDT
jgi:hypothetical protein